MAPTADVVKAHEVGQLLQSVLGAVSSDDAALRERLTALEAVVETLMQRAPQREAATQTEMVEASAFHPRILKVVSPFPSASGCTE